MELKDKVLRPKFKLEHVKSDNPDFIKLVDSYVRWSDDTEYRVSDREEYENEIRSCFDQFDFDGYNLAEHLKDTYYISPDSELVDLLDDVFYVRNSILRKMIKSWVTENFLTIPDNVIGKKVNVKQGYRTYENYYITGVKPDFYQVTIDQNMIRKGGLVIDFENVTFVE
jgi:hypothetical protein